MLYRERERERERERCLCFVKHLLFCVANHTYIAGSSTHGLTHDLTVEGFLIMNMHLHLETVVVI